jgi:hypothetical protein
MSTQLKSVRIHIFKKTGKPQYIKKTKQEQSHDRKGENQTNSLLQLLLKPPPATTTTTTTYHYHHHHHLLLPPPPPIILTLTINKQTNF